MTKEALMALGLTDEQAEKALAAHKDAITGGYIPKGRFDEVNTEKKQLKEQIEEMKGQIEQLKTASGASEKLKEQIAELLAVTQQKEKEHAAELRRVKRESLDERLLLEADAINPIAVKPFLAAIDDGVDDEGYTALRRQHIEALSKADSTKFLFKAAGQAATITGLKPGETGTQQPQNGTPNPFMKDTYNEAEQIRLFRTNPDQAVILARQAGLNYI